MLYEEKLVELPVELINAVNKFIKYAKVNYDKYIPTIIEQFKHTNYSLYEIIKNYNTSGFTKTIIMLTNEYDIFNDILMKVRHIDESGKFKHYKFKFIKRPQNSSSIKDIKKTVSKLKEENEFELKYKELKDISQYNNSIIQNRDEEIYHLKARINQQDYIIQEKDNVIQYMNNINLNYYYIFNNLKLKLKQYEFKINNLTRQIKQIENKF